MKNISAILWTESLKVRKSKIFWGTIIFFIFISSMMGLLVFVQKYPEVSGKLGMIGNKASMMRFGELNWQNYFKLLIQVIAGIGLVGIGFITSWTFGREYSEHTIKDILVLPVSRTNIVLSKFIVIVTWSIILSVVFFFSSLVIGLIIEIPGFSMEVVFHNASIFAVTFLMTILLCTPIAFLASYSRGYILPLGFVILTLIVANFSGLVGLGPYFPWAIPGLYGTPGDAESMQLNSASYFILICTSLLGLYGTIAYWRHADQK